MMYEWTSFSREVILEANRKLSQRERGAHFALPEELVGVFNFKPKTTEEIDQAFRTAAKRLRQGTRT